MSTRATYTIRTSRGQQYTFYIHHDGYPAGAATYILAALLHTQENRGGFADAFLRANNGAEFTGNKDSHGDTEFHYLIEEHKPNDLTVTQFAIKYNSADKREFINEGKFPIEEFINLSLKEGYKTRLAYSKRMQITDEVEKPELVFKINGRFYTQSTAKQAWKESIEEYKDYATKFSHYSGNCEGYYNKIGTQFKIIVEINRLIGSE